MRRSRQRWEVWSLASGRQRELKSAARAQASLRRTDKCRDLFPCRNQRRGERQERPVEHRREHRLILGIVSEVSNEVSHWMSVSRDPLNARVAHKAARVGNGSPPRHLLQKKLSAIRRA